MAIFIKRRLLDQIKPFIQSPEIIVITGMRRVGKTTLLRMLYEKIESANKVFIDLENLLNRKLFQEDDFNNIWNNLKPLGISKADRAYIFIDEIQLQPEIVHALKYLHDHYNVKFFASGSSSFYLKNLFPESLAGRKIIFELFPLDFHEFLRFRDIDLEFTSTLGQLTGFINKVRYEKTVK